MSESSGLVTNIKWAVNFLLPLSLLLLPESEAFTWNIKVFLAITLWGVMGYAMELTDNLVVSLIMMFMYGLSGIGPWTADPAWMTLGALIIVSIVQKTTILKRMAYYAAIHTNGSYMKLVLAMATLALIARVFLQGTMACIAVIVVAYGICEALKLGRSRASAGLMVATVIFYMDANYFIYSPDFHSLQCRRARGEHCSLVSPVLRGQRGVSCGQLSCGRGHRPLLPPAVSAERQGKV